MDILVCPKLFKEYLTTNFIFLKNAKQKDVRSIIENENIRILFNKRIDEAVQKIIKENNKLVELYQTVLTHLVSTRRIVNINATEEQTIEEDFIKSLIDSYNSTLNIKKSNVFIPFSMKTFKSTTTCALEEYNKPNIHWFGYKLASNSPDPVCLRNFDIKKDDQLREILEFIININSLIKYIVIFDRNLNLIDNLIFETIKKKFKIHYHTLYNYRANIQNKTQLLDFFGSLNMFVTNKDVDLHERRIFINEIIIELDEDFWNINKARDTWFINFTYCNFIRNEYLIKEQESFTRFF